MMRLLILAGSANKRQTLDLLPAVERYNGPIWRTLRTTLHGPQPLAIELDVYALSAEFGLIPAIQPIPAENRNLDAARVSAIRPLVTAAMERMLSRSSLLWGGYQSTLICGGRIYQSLLPDPLPIACGIITRANGTISQQLQQFNSWLEQAA